MKTSTAQLLVVLFAASARATGEACASVALSAIPVCAQQCFINGAANIGCSGVDFECHCKQQPALYAAIEACVAQSCAASEFQAVIDGAAAVCNCVNGGGAGAGPVPSGSVVPTPPEPTPSVPITTGTAAGGGGGGGGGSASGGATGGSGGRPTRTSHGGGATSSVVPGAASQSKSQLGLAVAALLGLTIL